MAEAHEATYPLESINWLSFHTIRTKTCAVELIDNKYNPKRKYIT